MGKVSIQVDRGQWIRAWLLHTDTQLCSLLSLPSKEELLLPRVPPHPQPEETLPTLLPAFPQGPPCPPEIPPKPPRLLPEFGECHRAAGLWVASGVQSWRACSLSTLSSACQVSARLTLGVLLEVRPPPLACLHSCGLVWTVPTPDSRVCCLVSLLWWPFLPFSINSTSCPLCLSFESQAWVGVRVSQSRSGLCKTKL